MRLTPDLTPEYSDPHSYPAGVAWQDGQYIPVSQAKISVLDYGFLHSDATYDTVHVWDGAFFRLDAHIERFLAGVERLRMTLPVSVPEIREILHNCVSLSGYRRAYVEMVCTRGTARDFSRDPRAATNRFLAFAVPYGSVADDAQMKRGLHVTITNTTRIPPSSVDPRVKNYHWLDLIGGLFDAYDRGGETALLLDSDGNIAEGPGFNAFSVRDGALITPEHGVLRGITRRTVMEIGHEQGRTVREGTLTRDALRSSDEVFITSTAGGVMPVTRIDGAPVNDGAVGPVTRAIMSTYWAWHKDKRFVEDVVYPSQETKAPS
ncbi:branched-chain amino acid transferase [Salipiger pallidus]|uniref:Probable branched-chain-amino-acid aminotransferase n=1 Tax=Salipiger pallidus TaxID=1775170 RepID=A0A8J2ZJP0_9RHOB|nr:aminotransferase class IV [Salipiger pallidus]GGG72567.1 branched-chain amino acid transferase [Salipiger pallidus]